jgi:manganese efflux pump family protein
LLNKLVKKFNAKSNKHLLIIFIIFALSGSGSLFISSPILSAINLDDLIKFYPLYVLVRIIIIIPIYQFMLIIIATIFGEFNYFWKFEKKLLQRLKLIK